MKRAGKKTKKKSSTPPRRHDSCVKNDLKYFKPVFLSTNAACMAAVVRTLYQVYEWEYEQIGEFLGSYLVLLDEIGDKRSGVNQFVRDTEALTGVDIRMLLQEVYKWE